MISVHMDHNGHMVHGVTRFDYTWTQDNGRLTDKQRKGVEPLDLTE